MGEGLLVGRLAPMSEYQYYESRAVDRALRSADARRRPRLVVVTDRTPGRHRER